MHPSLLEAIARIEADEFGVIGSTSPRYPQLSFAASTGISGSSGQPGGLDVIRTGLQRSFGYGITLNQQISDFGRTRHSIKLSELQLGVTRLNYLLIRQQVLDNVVQSYFNLLQQEQAIKVSEANTENAQVVLDRAQGFLEAGTGAKIAVIQAEADVANARFGLVQARGAHARATATLAQAMGLTELEDVQLEETFLEIPDWDAETARSLALKARPDVVASSLSVAQAQTSVRLAKAEYYPRISANAGLNWNDSVFPPQNRTYNVGLSLSVPIINEPGLSAAVGQAKANHKAALQTYRSVELQATQEATSALYTLREAEGRAESATQALRFSTENYRLATERYKVGVGNSLEVSQAQRQLVESRTQELQARFDVQNAIGTLLRTTGQLDTEALLPPNLVVDPIFDIPESVIPREQK